MISPSTVGLRAVKSEPSATGTQESKEDSPISETNWKILFMVALSVAAYLLLGGLLFNYLEHQFESDNNAGLQAAVKLFLAQNPGVDGANFSAFLNTYAASFNPGYTVGENGTVNAPPSKWDFPSAVFFCLTVITTIGYGNLAPSTSAGQSICCVYALLGIPLLAVFLGGVSGQFKVAIARLHDCPCWRGRHGRSPFVAASIVYLSVGFVLFFALPALVFTYTEGWSYSISIYCCLISLTSIGFGDYVPGQSYQSDAYKFCLFGWIFMGMVFVSGLVQTVQVVIEKWTQAVQTRGVAHIEELAERHLENLVDQIQHYHRQDDGQAALKHSAHAAGAQSGHCEEPAQQQVVEQPVVSDQHGEGVEME